MSWRDRFQKRRVLYGAGSAASVLLVLWTGHKPTKRQWETLQLYWLGWVTEDELTKKLGPKKKR